MSTRSFIGGINSAFCPVTTTGVLNNATDCYKTNNLTHAIKNLKLKQIFVTLVFLSIIKHACGEYAVDL